MHGHTYIKSVTVFDAIRWISSAWNKVREETILKCFRRAGFASPETDWLCVSLCRIQTNTQCRRLHTGSSEPQPQHLVLNTISSSIQRIQPIYSWRWAYRCPKHVELFIVINKLLHQVGISRRGYKYLLQCTIHIPHSKAETATYIQPASEQCWQQNTFTYTRTAFIMEELWLREEERGWEDKDKHSSCI